MGRRPPAGRPCRNTSGFSAAMKWVRINKTWFFDVSNGIEEVSERGGDQVDHGDVGGGVSVSACLCPSGLEETVEALHAGVAVACVNGGVKTGHVAA